MLWAGLDPGTSLYPLSASLRPHDAREESSLSHWVLVAWEQINSTVSQVHFCQLREPFLCPFVTRGRLPAALGLSHGAKVPHRKAMLGASP